MRVAADNDVALAVGIHANLAGARHHRQTALQIAERVRNRDRVNDRIFFALSIFVEPAEDIGQHLEVRAVGDRSAHDDRPVEADDLHVGLVDRRPQHLRDLVDLLFGDGDFVSRPAAIFPDENGRMARGLAVDDQLGASDGDDASDASIAHRYPGQPGRLEQNGVARLDREQLNGLGLGGGRPRSEHRESERGGYPNELRSHVRLSSDSQTRPGCVPARNALDYPTERYVNTSTINRQAVKSQFKPSHVY